LSCSERWRQVPWQAAGGSRRMWQAVWLRLRGPRLAWLLAAAALVWLRLRKLRGARELLGWASHGRRRGAPGAALPAVGTVVGHVARLELFPLKSAQAVSVERAAVGAAGLEADRVVMVLNARGAPVTQRMLPELARLRVDEVNLLRGRVRLAAPAELHVDPLELDVARAQGRAEHEAFEVDLHGLVCRCVPFGAGEDAWLCRVLDLLDDRRGRRSGYRLVTVARGERRHVHWSAARALMRASRPHDATLLADLAPLSLISEASLAALNEHVCGCRRQEGALEPACQCVPADRFRSNLVVRMTDSSLAFLEDHVETLTVGDTELRVMGPTFRCCIPSVCQRSGEAGFRKGLRTPAAEPLPTLKALRPGGLRFGLSGLLPNSMGGSAGLAPLFGIYLGCPDADSRSELRVGDPVRVAKYRDAPGPLATVIYLVGAFLGLAHPA
jgi:uncharacterized protein YcbX